jgi:2-polyprenyl-3-methyl-5-hydroxy-6-metoxy-1,4-benzoquinol methylase
LIEMAKLDFSRRAELQEQIDGPCSYEDLRICLRDLSAMNRLTRAHRPILLWLEETFSPPPSHLHSHHPAPVKLIDVGCGYGDMLRRVERWAAKRGVAMELVGVDVNANTVRAAREASPASSRVSYVLGDACECTEAQDGDVITASGMTHHLSEAGIVRLLVWMEQTARLGWVVTDLHRMPIPYWTFSGIARGPWWHRFIRPDGMISIRRAFREEDWRRICAAAKIETGAVEIRTHRPARLVVSRRK